MAPWSSGWWRSGHESRENEKTITLLHSILAVLSEIAELGGMRTRLTVGLAAGLFGNPAAFGETRYRGTDNIAIQLQQNLTIF
ncbi:MAG TPA: hypothetical protein DCL15_08405 [Chloroflexi bacterium]|nr:hypothetical protein [Chloroflexota bacterium]